VSPQGGRITQLFAELGGINASSQLRASQQLERHNDEVYPTCGRNQYPPRHRRLCAGPGRQRGYEWLWTNDYIDEQNIGTQAVMKMRHSSRKMHHTKMRHSMKMDRM
jgi:hypothetical protein